MECLLCVSVWENVVTDMEYEQQDTVTVDYKISYTIDPDSR